MCHSEELGDEESAVRIGSLDSQPIPRGACPLGKLGAGSERSRRARGDTTLLLMNCYRNNGVNLLFMSPRAPSVVLVPARYAFMLLRMTSDTCGYCADTGRDFAPSTTGSASANQGFALSTSGSLYTP